MPEHVNAGLTMHPVWILAGTIVLAVLAAFVAFKALGRRAQKRLADRSLEILRHSTNEPLKLAAIAELALLEERFAYAALSFASRDRSAVVREAAIRALERKGRAAAERLREAQRRAASGAAPASLGYYLGLLYDLTQPEKTLRNYILPGLIAALKDQDARIRDAAIAALQTVGTPEALLAIRVARRSLAPDGLQVSAYYPKEIEPHVWSTLFGHLYRSSATEAVKADLAARVGVGDGKYQGGAQQVEVALQTGTTVTASLDLDLAEVNPPTQSVRFMEDFHRFEFRVRAPESALSKDASGTLSFTVEGIIIASVPISISINRFVHQSEPVYSSQAAYTAVFCCYSYQDQEVVDRVEAAYRALRIEFLRDITTLRSGQKWNRRLLTLIEMADVFQLFWSINAAASREVRREWQHALAQHDKGERFIRPVYWTRPLQKLPAELKHLHFAYHPELAKATDKRSGTDG